MNNLRKYIELIEQGEDQRLDERGGVIDKFVSKLGIIPGQTSKDIASAAKGKVKGKEIYLKVRDAWIQHATQDDIKKNDSAALKAYLTDFLELPVDFVENLPGLDKPKADLKTALMGVSSEMAKYVDKMPSKGKGRAKKAGPQVKRADLDPKVLAVMKNKLGGDVKNILNVAKQAKTDLNGLRKRPLALMGYLVLEDAGAI